MPDKPKHTPGPGHGPNTGDETMDIVRTLRATNGDQTHELGVIRKADGSHWLQDLTADPNADSLDLLQDDSDSAVMDALEANGFEILADD
jgi:hypothetical protein